MEDLNSGGIEEQRHMCGKGEWSRGTGSARYAHHLRQSAGSSAAVACCQRTGAFLGMSAAEDSGGEDRAAESKRGAAGDDAVAAPAADGAGGGDEPKAAKARRPRPKLTVEALLNEDNGLPSVPFQMKGKRFAQDNVQLIS